MNEEFKKITKRNFLAFAFCPHSKLENCFCRKPKNGLIVKIIEYYKNTPRIFFGDKTTDIEAANSISIEGILVHEGQMLATVQNWVEYDRNKSTIKN
jgi:D-glycero-D-manno-heptose 1,7-bisphosphate phosphatase